MARERGAAQQRIVALSCVRAARVEDGEHCVFSGSRAHLGVSGRRSSGSGEAEKRGTRQASCHEKP